IKKHFDTLEDDLAEKDRRKIRDLLSNLFPNLDTAFGNYHFSNQSHNEWYTQKRIVSTKYFDRYFSYAVIDGDISDVEFDLLLEFVEKATAIEEITKRVSELLEKTSTDNLLHKLRSLEKDYSWASSKKIAKAICNLSDQLPKEGGMMSMGFETPFGQAAIFIYQLLKNHIKEPDAFDFAKELMTYPKQFEFAYNLNNWFRSGDRKEDKIFEDSQYVELAKVLTERAVDESKESSIFEMFPEHVGYLGHTWAERDKKQFDNYVLSYLKKNDHNVIKLLYAFVPTIRSTAKPEPYKGDLTKDRYEYMVSFFDKDDLLSRINTVYSVEEIEKEEPKWSDYGEHEYSELNMVRQFNKWFQEQKDKEKE
ncbi:MAG: hypothetical protein KC506_01350, partial [Nanoarchaeota archaeon]|nr:hypothetical protein [Nanoarchaeota archaeon]